MMMLNECLIVVLTVFAVTVWGISNDDRNTIIDKLNQYRAAAGASNMRKLIYDSTVVATAPSVSNDDCKPKFDTGEAWIAKGATLSAALDYLDSPFTAGKNEYDGASVCSPAGAEKPCKVYREITNALSTKVNCDLGTCTNSDDNSEYKIIKCVLEPAYTGSDPSFTKGDDCSACGSGYKCDADGKLCIADTGNGGGSSGGGSSSSGGGGGCSGSSSGCSGVNQLTENIILIGLAVLFSMFNV